MRPPHIQIIFGPVVHKVGQAVETADIVAPKSKTRQTDMEPCPDCSRQSVPSRGTVSTPVHRVALAPCPAGPGPDRRLIFALSLFRNLESRLLIQQRIEIVEFGAAHPVEIERVLIDPLAEISLDHFRPKIKEVLQKPLVPADSFRVGKIYPPSVLDRAKAGGIAGSRPFAGDVAFVSGFGIEFCFLGDIRCLPQRDPDTHLPHLFHISLGVGKGLLVELPVALPVPAEPTGVKMNDIAWKSTFPELADDFQRFFGREIGHAAHPDPVRPKGHIAGKAGNPLVVVDYFGGVSTADEKQIETI